MQRLMRVLALYGRMLYVVTTLFIIAFQCYWLYGSFQLRKRQIIEQTELLLDKKIVSLSLDQIAALGSSRNGGQLGGLNLDSLMKSVGSNTVIKPVFIIKDLHHINAKPVLSNGIVNPLINDAGYDSLLYHYLIANSPSLSAKSGLVIYRTMNRKMHTYPAGRPEIQENTTNIIGESTGNVPRYQAYIGHLDSMVLLAMAGQFCISACYLILFFATIAVLMYTARLNRQLLQSKEVFTRNMTHELKIPISTLSIASEALNTYHAADNPEEARKYAGIIQRALGQLSAMVETILNHARAGQGKTALHLAGIRLLPLMEEIVSSMHTMLAKQEAIVTLAGLPADVIVYGDQQQLRHVFTNLIDNAVKYAVQPPEIHISATRKNNDVIISVQDNGIGIPTRYFDEVFQPYFRVADRDVHEVKGFGLGLSFVKEIVKLHKGSIRILQSGAQGTVIELKLPAYGV